MWDEKRTEALIVFFSRKSFIIFCKLRIIPALLSISLVKITLYSGARFVISTNICNRCSVSSPVRIPVSDIRDTVTVMFLQPSRLSVCNDVSVERANTPVSVMLLQLSSIRVCSAVSDERAITPVSVMFVQSLRSSDRSAVSDVRADKPVAQMCLQPISCRVCSAVNKDSADNPVLVTCLQ